MLDLSTVIMSSSSGTSCYDVMSPDGGDASGGPGQDHAEVYEGEAGEEAVEVQRKCHHNH